MSNKNLTDHIVYRDTLVSLLRDLEVCRELMVSDPLNLCLMERYYTTICLLFQSATGDKLTKREAIQVFVKPASTSEKRAAYGS